MAGGVNKWLTTVCLPPVILQFQWPLLHGSFNPSRLIRTMGEWPRSISFPKGVGEMHTLQRVHITLRSTSFGRSCRRLAPFHFSVENEGVARTEGKTTNKTKKATLNATRKARNPARLFSVRAFLFSLKAPRAREKERQRWTEITPRRSCSRARLSVAGSFSLDVCYVFLNC